MKFGDIVGLQDYFQPVFNIANETKDYWKQFIPNDIFYELLDKTLLSVNSANAKDKLSIWLVGRYGTGKSHASGVIKHLLWDDFDKIEDYIEDRILKAQMKAKIMAFRNNNRIMPIILKGGGNIIDARTLSLEIEREVKRSLKDFGISIQVKSDFERIIEKIDDNYLNWDVIIEENNELNRYVNSKEDIVKKLENNDEEILKIVENILSEKRIHFSHEEISVWLREVSDEIVKRGIASGIMIFWDEFTTMLEKEAISEIINEIQSIAELSTKDNVYLYLISHRDYNQFGKNVQEVFEKVKGRFHNIKYPMTPITTYQILSSAFKKKDKEEWENLKNRVFNNMNLDRLTDYITRNIDGADTKNSIKNLYPMHPYTVYLSTFLANNIGSTQRSIFNFIYDDKFGFIKFLENEVTNTTLLTADLLWDFYADELDNDMDNRFMQVLEKYNTYKGQLENENPYYLKVFKGVLLLNALYRITDYSNPDTDKVRPHINNIKNLFLGTEVENYVDRALEYIDKQEIIQKNPNELFEISNISPDRNEVEAEKKNLENQYNDITKIIEIDGIKYELERFFGEDNEILRETRVGFFSSNTNLNILRNSLSKNFSPSYFIDFAVFLKMSDDENSVIDNLINQIRQEEDFRHIIFIKINESFKEDRYKRFIEYLARSNVSRNHAFNEESAKEEKFAADIIRKWVNSINYIDIYASFLSSKVIKDIKSVGQYINNDIAPKIFNKGIDAIGIKTATVWRLQSAKKAIEYVLTANDRNDIETQPKNQYSYIRDIFKDRYSEYVVDNKLQIKPVPSSHPVIEICEQVKDKIERASQKSSFNLAEELKFLTQPPYGLYTNILNMAILGYVFRDFVDKLYITNTGIVIDTLSMRDKINELFECWQKNRGCDKLNVRLGSEEEKELVKELAVLFNIQDYKELQDIRWKIKDKVKEIGYPIWSLKFSDIEYESHKEIIDKINKIVSELTDTDVNIDFIKELLSDIQNNSLDLKQIFIDENFENGFKKFIIESGDGKIDYPELDEVINYIRQNQPEEWNWKEQDIENLVLKFVINKETQPVHSGTKPPIPPPFPPSAGGDFPPNSEEVENVKKKIEDIQDIDDLKDKILKLIDENPFIAKILNRYL